MTYLELNRVRDLHKRIRDMERHLAALRMSMANITPVIDGLPHSSEIKSRVEKIALQIVDDELELDALRGQLSQAKGLLVELIMSEVNDPVLQTLLILRYVACCSFKETARLMRYGLRHIFKLHEKFLKDGICRHIATHFES